TRLYEKKLSKYLKELGFEINAELKKIQGEGPTEAKLSFKDKNGKYITGKEITASLSCRNSSILPDPVIAKTTTGEMTIKIPADCGKLYVDSVQAQGFQNWFGPINSAIETIFLQEEEVYFQELGDLRIIVKNPEGELLNGIQVKLMKGISKISEETTETGIAYFAGIETGYYDILLQDPTLSYEIKKVYSIEITQETVNEKIIELELTQNETLKINVFDKEDGSLIPNAKVILEDSSGEIIGEGNTGETADTVEFALHSTEGLTVKVSAEGYLPETVEVTDETEIDVELEIITAQNSGKLLINLVDEDGKKVINAKVFLKDQDGSILTEYPEKISDANGSVKYSGIKEGKYYAYAKKYPASGTSEEFEIHLTEETIIEFVLTIGNAVLNLNTVDSDREAIPNTRVKVKSLDEEKEYVLDAEGKTTITLKADKRVYFEFYDPNENYSAYITTEYTLFPKEYNITAVMQEKVIGENLEMEFLGLFNGSEEAAEIIAGEKYTAKLKLIIPSNAKYETAGVHFRTGNDDNPFFENDPVWLEKINAAGATKTKGKTWNPLTGQNTDFASDNLASINAQAKWTNIVWRNPKPGIYEAEIEVKTKEDANEPIRIHFRAWGKTRAYYYYPSDNVLGSAPETGTKQGLYAQTFEMEYNPEELIVIPEVPICNEEICLLGQKMIDLTEEPYLIQREIPFKTKSNGLYEYQFKIVNNSETIYDNPELWISLVEGDELET
ncbi:carboxypeptidase-like regulatory domain-containing protein, partial [Candidatus Micrarchaeota archaeon]|nr:carboxypeptidase-like regulatory domain-containing protein [Candidatus Micrarchaeota archaeon]